MRPEPKARDWAALFMGLKAPAPSDQAYSFCGPGAPAGSLCSGPSVHEEIKA
jgi:hypothetical protein